MKLHVYILILDKVDGFYVGTTKNLARRVADHVAGIGGVISKHFGVKGVLSAFQVRGYKELEIEEVKTIRFLKALGYRCWGAGWNDPNK